MAQALLNDLGNPEAELSILVTDDAGITEINNDYFSRPWPTNVIAFSMAEGEFANINPESKMLGDIVISMETAIKEAKDADLPVDERFAQLLVHGLLHIEGYDHEKPESDTELMEKESERLIAVLKKEGLIAL